MSSGCAGREDVRASRSREPRRPDVTTVELVGGVEALELEHIGSTSVPGLAAEPIVDVVVAVDEYLLLRDHLRSDADDRTLCESTERTLISERWDDVNDYADARTDVTLAIEARARAARGR
ncbi:GrpB family protein [Kineococcus auxinigenes]|uniref:GrpB family protein n=1 Tax=unclassified Kineococcus TaxID=2621656 RepID=UPI003D7E3C99